MKNHVVFINCPNNAGKAYIRYHVKKLLNGLI